jgi:hypothetical protein
LRILDIAIAAAYGILCLSLISFMGPYGSEHGTAQAVQDADASSAIFAYVNSVGLPFLATSTPSQACSSIEAWGNSTLTMGGSVDGYPCSGAPGEFLGSSSLDLALSGRDVKIEAWEEGQ